MNIHGTQNTVTSKLFSTRTKAWESGAASVNCSLPFKSWDLKKLFSKDALNWSVKWQ